MTAKEIRKIVEEANFYASSYNYSRSHNDEERAARMLSNFETVSFLADKLGVSLDIVKSESFYFAVVGTDIGGGKYYALWSTSCHTFVDDETFREFTRFTHNRSRRFRLTVYTTDGKGGMMISECADV